MTEEIGGDGLTARAVEIHVGVPLQANLAVPPEARGVVLFANASGSSRASATNRYLASQLQATGLATLVLDLLTADEELADLSHGRLRFDIQALASRLTAATGWLRAEPSVRGLPIGYLGSSTGASAALVAATEVPGQVAAIVSRAGWPDLAGPALGWLHVPTLLIVGEGDEVARDLNREALARLDAPKELAVIKGAGHLLDSPDALAEVARLARDWFVRFLCPAGVRGG